MQKRDLAVLRCVWGLTSSQPSVIGARYATAILEPFSIKDPEEPFSIEELEKPFQSELQSLSPSGSKMPKHDLLF